MANEIIDVHGHLPVVGDEGLLDKMVQSMRVNNVGKVFISSLGRDSWLDYPDEKDIAQANEDVFALCCKMPKNLRGYVYLNPNHASWQPELDKWVSNRFFVGVKLWISLKDENGSSDICLPILERGAEENFPVLIHCFFRHGGQLKGELSPTEVVRLSQKVPQAKIIMAHLGGSWEKALKAVADQSNIYTDVSGFPASRGSVECAVRHCGSQRVLFGSDVPCRTFQSQLHKVYAAEVEQDVKANILQNNATSLFGSI
ncbi:MAG: amidohydrolase family protein [Sedimentisphaerales bacterium]|nr:amidohydrolase family protein [Sedimentisphaerales bacterium]